MTENLISKITAEVLSSYAVATQHRPDNDIACRTMIRRAIPSELQPYVDSNLIASYTVVCDESNNTARDIKQPTRLDVFVKITKQSRTHIISLPLKKQKQPQQMEVQQNNSFWDGFWDDLNDLANLLWDKITRNKK
jgi:hypothetical protein